MSETATAPPYFHALASFACQANRLYRIYMLPDELLLIWAGSGSEGMAGARAVATRGGALPALIGSLSARWLDPTQKNQARKVVLDSTPPDQLIGDHPKNLRAPLSEFITVKILNRSDRHARLYSDHEHQALLSVRHKSIGNHLLGIRTVEDAQVAMSVLPSLLPHSYESEIPPPKTHQPCGCVFCRQR